MGPSAALKGPGHRRGLRGNALANGMSKFTPRVIMYVAVQVMFSLSHFHHFFWTWNYLRLDSLSLPCKSGVQQTEALIMQHSFGSSLVFLIMVKAPTSFIILTRECSPLIISILINSLPPVRYLGLLPHHPELMPASLQHHLPSRPWMLHGSQNEPETRTWSLLFPLDLLSLKLQVFDHFFPVSFMQ